MKRAASPNSDVEDMMNFIIWEKVRSGLLLAGMGTSSERNSQGPARLLALLSLRKDAPE